MVIECITIKGFRSFGTAVRIPTREKLTTFIGHNSSGKTAALDALRKIFGGTNAERELTREDFHISADDDATNVDDKELYIEVRLNFSNDDEESIAHLFSDMVVDKEGSDPYIRIRLEAVWRQSDIYQEGEIDFKLFFINVAESESESEDSKRMFPNHLRKLVQFIYVPAIRKPADQIKYASGSMLYRVLRKIRWDEDFKQQFEEKISDIGVLFSNLAEFNTIEASINQFWGQFHKDPRYSETILSFGQSDFESVLKRLEVSFSPSGVHRHFQVDELGEGYRSLFYFTLVCALLEVEDKLAEGSEEIGITRPVLTILAIEEPENHIAPQLLGRVISVLKKISESAAAQVLLSSHTPTIVKRVSPECICHFRIDERQQTEVNTIVLPAESHESYKYVKEAIHNFPEIYFAKLVVIGEGDSEQVIFNKLADVLDVDFDDNIITFAPLGHRFVNHIWRLLRALHIPYVTILDFDLERDGGGWGRIKYILKQLNLIGYRKEELLELEGGNILSDEDFIQMHKWEDVERSKGWIEFLEDYNVYFASPLDIDFLMLEQYLTFYKKTIPKDRGPNIPNKTEESKAFSDKVRSSVQATLKSEKAIGKYYSDDQKELMIWYCYHFLGRGKPATHIHVLSQMTNKDIKASIPIIFEKIFKKIEGILKK